MDRMHALNFLDQCSGLKHKWHNHLAQANIFEGMRASDLNVVFSGDVRCMHSTCRNYIE